ncbi:MerR family transcriptional regulator [Isoptericola sp. BMS4]|uniref:MerR family transcriptional regulator n=1 Tax=Isoptericola sp. BMS4 TaxID=2527875 RepID=UPI001422CB06|nr:MerR family transcriptional regulator [Isoptericola sp. BMS4]
MSSGVTIGQAAAYAGVTVKAVRHYHKLGLVPEPERDHSGYRRYGSAELLRLVQVRTLAGAGVPLAEVGALLDADDAAFAAELVDVERRLTAQIEELVARRRTLRRLADGARTLLPERAVALLERMPGLGFGPEEVAASREGLVLARALVPERFDEHLAHVEHAIQDPEFVALSRRGAEAATWAPDDPRIPALAAEMADHYLTHPEHLRIVTGLQARSDTRARYRVVRDFGSEEGTAGERLVALVEARLGEAGVRIPRPDDG